MIGMIGADLFRGDAGVDDGARLWLVLCVAVSGLVLSPAWRDAIPSLLRGRDWDSGRCGFGVYP
jgi:hypothetical protein